MQQQGWSAVVANTDDTSQVPGRGCAAVSRVDAEDAVLLKLESWEPFKSGVQ